MSKSMLRRDPILDDLQRTWDQRDDSPAAAGILPSSDSATFDLTRSGFDGRTNPLWFLRVLKGQERVLS